jgi:hypothetical protein
MRSLHHSLKGCPDNALMSLCDSSSFSYKRTSCLFHDVWNKGFGCGSAFLRNIFGCDPMHSYAPLQALPSVLIFCKMSARHKGKLNEAPRAEEAITTRATIRPSRLLDSLNLTLMQQCAPARGRRLHWSCMVDERVSRCHFFLQLVGFPLSLQRIQGR